MQSTDAMLTSLLTQLMAPHIPGIKHGENVYTGHGGKVAPDALAPVRSRLQAEMLRERGGNVVGAGAAAAAGPAAGGGD